MKGASVRVFPGDRRTEQFHTNSFTIVRAKEVRCLRRCAALSKSVHVIAVVGALIPSNGRRPCVVNMN